MEGLKRFAVKTGEQRFGKAPLQLPPAPDNVRRRLGAYKLREFVDAVYFSECSEYTFEDGKFFGPKLYDGYLKSIYGDYMALPPEEKRIGKHKILKVEKIK